MVSDVQTPGLADADLDIGEGFDAADLDVGDAAPEAEVDPVAALREEISGLKQAVSELSGLRGLNPRQIQAVMGQIGALQRDFADLRKGDPLSSLDPRIAENEDSLGVIANALASSDMLEDSSRTSLRQLVAKIDSTKNARTADKLRQDLLREVTEARTEIAQNQPDPNAEFATEVAIATQRLMDFADGKNVPWNGIPSDELQFKPGESLEQAMTRVRKVINDLAGESAATERTANRRRAAGAGAPASVGTSGYRSQVAVRTAHANGELSNQQMKAMRDSGQLDALPFQ